MAPIKVINYRCTALLRGGRHFGTYLSFIS